MAPLAELYIDIEGLGQLQNAERSFGLDRRHHAEPRPGVVAAKRRSALARGGRFDTFRQRIQTAGALTLEAGRVHQLALLLRASE